MMVLAALWRNAHGAHDYGQLGRIRLLVDQRGVPTHGSRQCRASGGLREVSVRLGVRNDNVESVASWRETGNVNVNHVHAEIRGVGSARHLAGWWLGA